MPYKVWYDFEFHEDGVIIDPISLGMVDEGDRELYVINSSFAPSRANSWVKENVLPYLYDFKPDNGEVIEVSQGRIGSIVHAWIIEGMENVIPKQSLELIGYYADYDHVALSQLWGAMIQLPKPLPMYTKDIKQWADDLGDPVLPVEGKEGTPGFPHHGLLGAHWNKKAYNWLVKNYEHPAWTPRLQHPRLKACDWV